MVLGLIAIAGSAVALAVALANDAPRIAYVRSNELMLGYHGMAEARSVFQRQETQWRAELDSLQRAIDAASETSKRADLQRSYDLRRAEIEESSRKQDREMTQGIVNKLNTALAAFAERNAYDVILGTTESGSLLYGNPELDVTDKALQYINGNPGNAKR